MLNIFIRRRDRRRGARMEKGRMSRWLDHWIRKKGRIWKERRKSVIFE